MDRNEIIEVNNKIAKHYGALTKCGFCHGRGWVIESFGNNADRIPCSHCNGIGKQFVNLTDSMDACIKWIIPKLNVEITITNHRDCWYCQLYRFNGLDSIIRIDMSALTIPLAICLAVEKLIDGH